MIRFYKSYLGRAFLGLLILIELEKATDKQTVVDQVRKWTPSSPEAAQTVELLLDSYIHAYPDESPSNDEVLKGALGQLQKRRNDDSDLLDIIVNALKLPFTSAFGASNLRILRETVLSPSELSNLRKTYTATAKCACGHEFSSNEMVSATVVGGSITLKCTKCSRPQVARCDHCGQATSLIGKNAQNWRTDIDCGCRKKVERAAKAGIAVDIESPGLSTADAMRQLLRNQRLGIRAGRSIPLAPPPTSGGYISYTLDPPPAVAPLDEDDGGF